MKVYEKMEVKKFLDFGLDMFGPYLESGVT